MLANYFTTIIRQLRRHPGYALLNINGLAIGLACCLLILLYVQDELNFDRFHPNADRIYRIIHGNNAKSLMPLGPVLQYELPEVTRSIRIRRPYGSVAMRYGAQVFEEDQGLWVEKTFFDVFVLPFLYGASETAFKEPFSIVLTESTARRYFGDENPIGQTMHVQDWDLMVTGVIRDIPLQSHFKADYILSLTLMEKTSGWNLSHTNDAWYDDSYYTYVLLPIGYNPEALEQKIPSVIAPYLPQWFQDSGVQTDFSLQPITDIHLYSHLQNELASNSDIFYVYILLSAALFILLIACLNFVNLTTARATTRAKEVGLRKVVGASRSQLIRQFLGESICYTAVALVIALGVVEMILPLFSTLSGKVLSFSYVDSAVMMIGFTCLALFVGIFSGGYPALFLSAYQPMDVLKKSSRTGIQSSLLRKILVVVQFTVAIVILVGVGLIYEQLTYLRTRPVGYDRDHIMVVRNAGTYYERLKQALLQNPRISGVSRASVMPGVTGGRGMLPRYPVRTTEGKDQKAQFLKVDTAFLSTMGIHLIAGRDFRRDDTGGALSLNEHTDTKGAIILNETAARQLGWASPENAVGQTVDVWDGWHTGTVVGVLKDFHLHSLHHTIEPLLLVPWGGEYMSVRMQTEEAATTIRYIKNTYASIAPDIPILYSFLNEDLIRQYSAEDKLGNLLSVFSFLAIGVACIGLFGLASFASRQRTREIGVRKVLGASVAQIVVLFSKEVMGLIIIANVVAWPLAYLMMQRWLMSFAYRVNMSMDVFLSAGSVALLIALATVSYHALRTARANPVEALRYE